MLLSFKNLMRFSLPNYERFLWKHSCSGPKRRKRLRSDPGYSKYPNTIIFPSTRLRPCTWAPELCQNSGVSTLVPSEKGKKGVITLVPSENPFVLGCPVWPQQTSTIFFVVVVLGKFRANKVWLGRHPRGRFFSLYKNQEFAVRYTQEHVGAKSFYLI